MFRSEPRLIARLVVSIISVAIALALTYALNDVLRGNFLFLLLAAVVFNSLYGGLFSGTFTACLAALGHDYYHQLPYYTVSVATRHDAMELVVFLGFAIPLGYFGASVRSAYKDAEKSRRVADEQSRAREALLAVVSHDLKNPLTSIRISAELIRKTASVSEAPAVITRSAELITVAALQMEKLILDLLDVERIKSGKLVIVPELVEAGELEQDVLRLMKPVADRKRIELTVIEADPALRIWCDRARVLQVFSNIVGNAVKFTPENGKVIVECRARDGGALFTVTDTGPGIPEDQLPHVFDRFWQARQSAELGTGLGLSIAKGIVESHGGMIWIENAPGAGTRASFTFPASTAVTPLSRGLPSGPSERRAPGAPSTSVPETPASRAKRR